MSWAADEEGGIIPSNPADKVQAPRKGKAAKQKPKRLPFDREALVRIDGVACPRKARPID